MRSPSLDPGMAGDWGVEIRGSFVSMTSWPRLQSNRQYSHTCAKWVHQNLLPQVNSNSRVRLGPPSLACYQQEEQSENNVSVAPGSAYCDYPYLFYPPYPGAYQLSQSCRYPHQRGQLWRRLWHQYACPIIPKYLHNILSKICYSSDVYNTLTCCSPCVWGVHCIHKKKGRLFELSIGVSHALHCGVQWKRLLCCS